MQKKNRQTREQPHSGFHTQSIFEGNSTVDQNKFWRGKQQKLLAYNTSSFAFTGVFEDNSSSVAMWLCHSYHLEQQLTCHLFTTNCTPDATQNQKERESTRLLAGAKAISWSPWPMWQINEGGHLAGRPFGSNLEANSDCLRWCDRLLSLLH